ncbi:peptidyl-prolyl cis-trans isomerase FKBP16-1, chloroplastic isoform X2 [Tripterygium wilfordii]|nr:peptidyl-prolyl cis-trans isomerase FKBP16-1, chloroplastic isoform X2 [Tripterygium wilfordii]XP_038685241.1 peptidyl-prolyl cis-trans isomerase FKBP16-1, chloroplastic isoform X2 [Tripterygium wilfordii]XP_038685242.1 peptidyl-prolyl cis-trans isomerase FKBP16-1, chloroplastic isoform X2 [Tripterygium wilfordii]
MDSGEPKDAMTKNLHSRIRPLTIQKVPRRVLLRWMGLSPMLCVFPVFAAPLPEMKEPEVIRTLKLPSGVRIQEIVEGEGPEAREGDLVQVNYVCRRSNGYFVYSTVDQLSGESMPVILPLDQKESCIHYCTRISLRECLPDSIVVIGQTIQGLKEVLVGMKVGGKRRALIPPYVGYINENLKPIPDEFGPRRSLLSHAQEPLVFEVQLLKVW